MTEEIERISIEIRGFGEITASPEVLNRIALFAGDAMELNRQKGMIFTADYARFVMFSLHDALAAIGLYEDYSDRDRKECTCD